MNAEGRLGEMDGHKEWGGRPREVSGVHENAAVKATTHLPVYVSYTHEYVETATSHIISCFHWFQSLRRVGVTTVNRQNGYKPQEA